MTQHYSDPTREPDPHALPDLETFYVSEADAARNAAGSDSLDSDYCTAEGWYWWSCFPGCLPDGDLAGPFKTEAEALADARQGLD